MINSCANVSAYSDIPPADNGDRAITEGPLYKPDDLVALANEEKITLWSRGAIRDAEKWELDTANVAFLVKQAIWHGQYLGSEWCEQKPKGPWAACDAWIVTIHEWIEPAGKSMSITYYLKFCIAKTGSMLLMVSNHPEGT